jgi:hypothetical protein
VGETVDVPRSEDETSAELKRVRAEGMLAMAAGAGAIPGCRIVAAQDMERARHSEANRTIGGALFVDEKREGDAGLVAKKTGIGPVAESDGGQARSAVEEGLLVFAQLRDMLAAENSAVVAKEDEHCRRSFPKRS